MTTASPVYSLDPARTSILVHTFAEGLLSRLAHDLEIEARGARGVTDAPDTGSIDVPVAELRVVGARKKNVVDPSALSASERADIEQKIRAEVLPGGEHVRVVVALEGARARLTVTTPVSRAREEGNSGEIVVSGQCDLSLKALGIAPVKGPMNAFRLSDRVE